MRKTDETNLTELLAHAAWARRLAAALVLPGDADDLCQDALLRALERRAFPLQPRAWLATVLRRLRHNAFRRDHRRRTREERAHPSDPQVTPEQSMARMELQRSLADVVAALDEPFRQAVILRFFDQLTAAQIARQLGIPAGTVRWRVSTALDRIRSDLDRKSPQWRRDWALLLMPAGRVSPPTDTITSAPPVRAAATTVSPALPLVTAATATLAAALAVALLHPGGASAHHVPPPAPPAQTIPPPLGSDGAGARHLPPARRAAVPAKQTQGGEGNPSHDRHAPLPFHQLPTALVQAFIASQDRRFFGHDGVDLRGVARALLANLAVKRVRKGGSTITQQLAKSYLGPEKTFARKFREIALARQLERQYSKEEIISRYLARVFLGHGAFGVVAAAHRYFNKNIAELDVAECALLAGIAHAPASSSPLNSPEAARARRNEVLYQMVETGALTRSEADHWAGLPLGSPPWAARSR